MLAAIASEVAAVAVAAVAAAAAAAAAVRVGSAAMVPAGVLRRLVLCGCVQWLPVQAGAMVRENHTDFLYLGRRAGGFFPKGRRRVGKWQSTNSIPNAFSFLKERVSF